MDEDGSDGKLDLAVYEEVRSHLVRANETYRLKKLASCSTRMPCRIRYCPRCKQQFKQRRFSMIERLVASTLRSSLGHLTIIYGHCKPDRASLIKSMQKCRRAIANCLNNAAKTDARFRDCRIFGVFEIDARINDDATVAQQMSNKAMTLKSLRFPQANGKLHCLVTLHALVSFSDLGALRKVLKTYGQPNRSDAQKPEYTGFKGPARIKLVSMKEGGDPIEHARRIVSYGLKARPPELQIRPNFNTARQDLLAETRLMEFYMKQHEVLSFNDIRFSYGVTQQSPKIRIAQIPRKR